MLQEIENRFPVQSIKINGEPFWPVLRSFFYNQILSDVLLKHPRSRFLNLSKLRNLFLGIWNWFKHWDYVVLSNEMERKKAGDIYVDKLTEAFIYGKGYENVLYIEQVKESHLPYSKYGKNITSLDTLIFIAGICLKLSRPLLRTEIQGEEIIKEIIAHYKFNSNYRTTIDTFLCKAFVFEKVLKRVKPKALIITDYGYFWGTYSAKRLGIKVVEFQHGVIGLVHPFYHPSKKLNNQFCPDYLLVFGKADKDALGHSNYVPIERIFPVGNFYLSWLANQKLNLNVQQLLIDYKYSICVPTDEITHEQILNFIKPLAHKMQNCVFIVTPRNPELKVTDSSRPVNIKFTIDHSFQEVVRHCDFHTATNSTCCLEALSLGSRNILIDRDGLASQYYGIVLANTNFTVFVKTIDEYENALLSMPFVSRKQTMDNNELNYMPDHESNLKVFLSETGL